MQVTAIFESWHIGDGNYPPLHKYQEVNLSFQLSERVMEVPTTEVSEYFTHLGDAEYTFLGRILKIYDRLLIIEANDFSFYIETQESKSYSEGSKIKGKGTLLFDYYIWVENIRKKKNPPNLFYNLLVTGIKKVTIPEKYIYKSDKALSYPTTVSLKEIPENYTEELETMEGQPFTHEFYIINFDSKKMEGKEIPHTFNH